MKGTNACSSGRSAMGSIPASFMIASARPSAALVKTPLTQTRKLVRNSSLASRSSVGSRSSRPTEPRGSTSYSLGNLALADLSSIPAAPPEMPIAPLMTDRRRNRLPIVESPFVLGRPGLPDGLLTYGSFPTATIVNLPRQQVHHFAGNDARAVDTDQLPTVRYMIMIRRLSGAGSGIAIARMQPAFMSRK